MLKTTDYKGKTMIWLDILNMNSMYPESRNQVFISEALSATLPPNFEFGILTMPYSWYKLVGEDWDHSADSPSSKGVALWYASVDKSTPDFDDFDSFGVLGLA